MDIFLFWLKKTSVQLNNCLNGHFPISPEKNIGLVKELPKLRHISTYLLH